MSEQKEREGETAAYMVRRQLLKAGAGAGKRQ